MLIYLDCKQMFTIFTVNNQRPEKMTPTIKQFKKTFTNGAGKKERRFYEMFGDISFEEAYPKYINYLVGVIATAAKISAFENKLRAMGVRENQSNISESRYYTYNGIKYRFSTHIHPTGSMTSDSCIDFAANPELIHNII